MGLPENLDDGWGIEKARTATALALLKVGNPTSVSADRLKIV